MAEADPENANTATIVATSNTMARIRGRALLVLAYIPVSKIAGACTFSTIVIGCPLIAPPVAVDDPFACSPSATPAWHSVYAPLLRSPCAAYEAVSYMTQAPWTMPRFWATVLSPPAPYSQRGLHHLRR